YTLSLHDALPILHKRAQRLKFLCERNDKVSRAHLTHTDLYKRPRPTHPHTHTHTHTHIHTYRVVTDGRCSYGGWVETKTLVSKRGGTNSRDTHPTPSHTHT